MSFLLVSYFDKLNQVYFDKLVMISAHLHQLSWRLKNDWSVLNQDNDIGHEFLPVCCTA
jgi:hypothetical protein